MNEIELTVQIYLRQLTFGSSGQISMEHLMTVKADGFMGLCRILGQFDELAKKVKAEAEHEK